ncbi:putative RNA recognition motif domain, nucleotide-binding alpha-beta plait domain superfamily [Helianthus anomalus]
MAGRSLEEDEWRDVPDCRNRNGRNKEKMGDRNVIKYYVSNLPFGCTPWEVKEFLGFYGDVVGTYIARKNDKEGNRFGFVTFKNVKNAKELEYKMNGVKMGRFILKVNIAKFVVENVGLKDNGEQTKTQVGNVNKGKEQQSMNRYPEANFNRQNVGCSYADLFKGNGRREGDVTPLQARNEFRTSSIIEVAEDMKAFHYLYGRALIGRTVDLNTLTKMDRFLLDEGFAGMEIHYVGGLSLMLKFRNNEEAVEFIKQQVIWKSGFRF